MRTGAVTLGLLLTLSTTMQAAPPSSALPPNATALQEAAAAFAATLTPEQRAITILPYDIPTRTDWHFYPKAERKGLEIKHMNDSQRAAADALLKAATGDAGYGKAKQVMAFEDLIKELEQGRSKNERHHTRFFYTLFGDPAKDARWGLSVEGHHLSINLVVENGRIIASTPQSICTNPATVKTENKTGIPVGTRVLEQEEVLAFELLNSLSDEQRAKAIVASEPPKEVRDPGKPRPAPGPAVGIPYSELNGEQRSLLIKLIQEFNACLPTTVARARLDKLNYDGLNEIHFAWAGSADPAAPHAYTVEAPSLRIEFVNIQSDPVGNVANHIHAVVRDLQNDFAITDK